MCSWIKYNGTSWWTKNEIIYDSSIIHNMADIYRAKCKSSHAYVNIYHHSDLHLQSLSLASGLIIQIPVQRLLLSARSRFCLVPVAVGLYKMNGFRPARCRLKVEWCFNVVFKTKFDFYTVSRIIQTKFNGCKALNDFSWRRWQF